MFSLLDSTISGMEPALFGRMGGGIIWGNMFASAKTQNQLNRAGSLKNIIALIGLFQDS